MSSGIGPALDQRRRVARQARRALNPVAALAGQPEEAIAFADRNRRPARRRAQMCASPPSCARHARDFEIDGLLDSARCRSPAFRLRHRHHADRPAWRRRERSGACRPTACSTRSRPCRRVSGQAMTSLPCGGGTTAMLRRLGTRPTGRAPASFAIWSAQAPAALMMVLAREFALALSKPAKCHYGACICVTSASQTSGSAARFEQAQIALMQQVDIDIGGRGVEIAGLGIVLAQKRMHRARFGDADRRRCLARLSMKGFGRIFLA